MRSKPYFILLAYYHHFLPIKKKKSENFVSFSSLLITPFLIGISKKFKKNK